jgi:hypothetical protein
MLKKESLSRKDISLIFKDVITDYEFRYENGIEDSDSIYNYARVKHSYTHDKAIAYTIAYIYRDNIPDYIFNRMTYSCMDDMKRLIDMVDNISSDDKSLELFVINNSKESMRRIYHNFTHCNFDIKEDII